MSTVKFTYALKRFFPDLQDLEVDAQDLHSLIDHVERKYPGVKSYILDEQGVLRKHVNLFIDGALIKDRNRLSDKLESSSEVFIMQALSGG